MSERSLFSNIHFPKTETGCSVGNLWLVLHQAECTKPEDGVDEAISLEELNEKQAKWNTFTINNYSL